MQIPEEADRDTLNPRAAWTLSFVLVTWLTLGRSTAAWYGDDPGCLTQQYLTPKHLAPRSAVSSALVSESNNFSGLYHFSALINAILRHRPCAATPWALGVSHPTPGHAASRGSGMTGIQHRIAGFCRGTFGAIEGVLVREFVQPTRGEFDHLSRPSPTQYPPVPALTSTTTQCFSAHLGVALVGTCGCSAGQ